MRGMLRSSRTGPQSSIPVLLALGGVSFIACVPEITIADSGRDAMLPSDTYIADSTNTTDLLQIAKDGVGDQPPVDIGTVDVITDVSSSDVVADREPEIDALDSDIVDASIGDAPTDMSDTSASTNDSGTLSDTTASTDLGSSGADAPLDVGGDIPLSSPDVSVCEAGRGDCDDVASNGCEVDLNVSSAHCGRCRSPCTSPTGGSSSCVNGTCAPACPIGQRVSASRCVPIEAPQPIWPPAFSVLGSRRPTLRWQLPEGVLGARLEVCRDRSCASVVTSMDVVGSEATLPSDLSRGVYFWRLFGRTSAGVGDSVSSTFWFRTRSRSTGRMTAMGLAPDYNGDGYGDIAAGTSNTRSYARVYLGLPAGLPATENTTLRWPIPDVYGCGFPITALGDINGDGYGDLGSNCFESAPAVHFGSPAGLATSPSSTRLTTGSSASVYSIGDINLDGYADVAVNLAYERLALHLGGPSGPSASPSIVLPTIGTGSFNYILGSIDINGDGLSDIVNSPPSGGIQVLQGIALFPFLSAGPRFSPMGRSTRVLSAGDVNGDGFADVIAANDVGQVLVLWGSSTGLAVTPVVLRSTSLQALPRFGASADAFGDVNGDGFTDLLIGEPGDNRILVYLGSATFSDSTPPLIISRPSDSGFGQGIRTGDFNRDGYDDAIVWDGFSRVFVFLGSETGLSTTPLRIYTAPSTDGFGSSLARRSLPSPHSPIPHHSA